MRKFSNGRASLKLVASRNWMFDAEPNSQIQRKTFSDVSDDHRLKCVLKRTVMRDYAPQSLIDSIKNQIRK